MARSAEAGRAFSCSGRAGGSAAPPVQQRSAVNRAIDRLASSSRRGQVSVVSEESPASVIVFAPGGRYLRTIGRAGSVPILGVVLYRAGDHLVVVVGIRDATTGDDCNGQPPCLPHDASFVTHP